MSTQKATFYAEGDQVILEERKSFDENGKLIGQSLNVPILEVNEWMRNRDAIARDVAKAMNASDDFTIEAEAPHEQGS